LKMRQLKVSALCTYLSFSHDEFERFSLKK